MLVDLNFCRRDWNLFASHCWRVETASQSQIALLFPNFVLWSINLVFKPGIPHLLLVRTTTRNKTKYQRLHFCMKTWACNVKVRVRGSLHLTTVCVCVCEASSAHKDNRWTSIVWFRPKTLTTVLVEQLLVFIYFCSVVKTDSLSANYIGIYGSQWEARNVFEIHNVWQHNHKNESFTRWFEVCVQQLWQL